jgi:hypothetical protein
MATYQYLRIGRKRPFHILGADGITAVCGEISKETDGAWVMNTAPEPLITWTVCHKCLTKEATAQEEALSLKEALERLRAVARLE